MYVTISFPDPNTVEDIARQVCRGACRAGRENRERQMGQEEVHPQFSRVARLDLWFVQRYLIRH